MIKFDAPFNFGGQGFEDKLVAEKNIAVSPNLVIMGVTRSGNIGPNFLRVFTP